MARQIVIDFTPGPNRNSDLYRIWIFGEALWAACRTDGWSSISLDDVDHATDKLTVSVRSARRVRRTVQMIEKLLAEHHLDGIAKLTVLKMPE
jgi:hypothetical protein